ncbi:MAG: copper-transporting ATPase [Chloroflexi bacterium HGW-Chloroflexi-8]|jgi:plastocyanin domain-containing protein|nr:MAG: copper-transporting ATPase [Chloroflexi bacterium HGW-Chloroflexi-8]
MTLIQIFITLGGIALSLFIAWFFWLAPKGQTRINSGAGGVQEVAITVKGGYTPDIIVVKAGQPLRMRFTRHESSTCSEMVLFPDFNQSAKLPEGQEVLVEFTPKKPGEYGFQCQMGMLRGKLIVE